MLLRDVILCNGGMMRKFIKITFQQGELGTKSELGGLKYHGLNLSGLHKEYHDMHSSSGWHSGTDFPHVFAWDNRRSHKAVCFVVSETRQGTTCFLLVLLLTFTIWTTLTASLLGTAASPDWTVIVTSVLRRNRPKLDIILLKLVFHATIYLVWREHNSRRHQCPWLPAEAIIRQIYKAIRNRISSLKYTGNHKFEGLLRRWLEVYVR